AGVPLDKAIRQYILEPLKIQDQVFYAGALSAERKHELALRAPPTERCEWRGRLIRGEVHDENTAALGGVSGHAGLFGTARGMATFGMAMVDVWAGRSDFLPKDLLTMALAPREGGGRRFGWDTSTQTGAAGRHMGPNTF